VCRLVYMSKRPAYTLKPGDMVTTWDRKTSSPREVFDVIDTFGGLVAIKFVDGTRRVVPNWDFEVDVR
jgi:hypothetical protein